MPVTLALNPLFFNCRTLRLTSCLLLDSGPAHSHEPRRSLIVFISQHALTLSLTHSYMGTQSRPDTHGHRARYTHLRTHAPTQAHTHTHTRARARSSPRPPPNHTQIHTYTHSVARANKRPSSEMLGYQEVISWLKGVDLQLFLERSWSVFHCAMVLKDGNGLWPASPSMGLKRPESYSKDGRLHWIGMGPSVWADTPGSDKTLPYCPLLIEPKWQLSFRITHRWWPEWERLLDFGAFGSGMSWSCRVDSPIW